MAEMNIRPIVNDKENWDAFKEYVNVKILSICYQQLKQESDEKRLFRLQGEIKALERILNLREEVNGGKK